MNFSHYYLQQEVEWEESRGEKDLCWGYEKGCTEETRLFVPRCDEPANPWARTLEEKHDIFWRQGDFGYIKQEVDTMIRLCYPPQENRSSFEKQIDGVTESRDTVTVPQPVEC